jgi:hypothetical protein
MPCHILHDLAVLVGCLAWAPRGARPVPYYQDSLFTVPAGRKLSREDRRIIQAQLRIHCRNRVMTRLHVAVIEELLKLRLQLEEGRLLYPSQEWLADLVGCCEKTVREALRRANRLGLVSWVRRIVRKGATVRQTSNTYELHPGTAKLVPRCAGRTSLEASSPRIIASPAEGAREGKTVEPGSDMDRFFAELQAGLAEKARAVR